MLVLPAIDLQKGRCVRLRQGVKDSTTVYSDDPLEVARRWQTEGARMLHVVNLDGAFEDEDSLNVQVVHRIVSEMRIPVQFGGGIRTLEQIETLASAGVARIVLGTVAVERPQLVSEAVQRFGERIVVGIDARDGQVVTRGWESAAPVSALELADRMKSVGVQRVVYTDVARDGMLTGLNFHMTERLAVESGLWITASGGVASLDDIDRLKSLPPAVDSCIVGKALYEGRFTLPEVLATAAGRPQSD